MSQKYEVNQVVQLRKLHPCGSDKWQILRVGMDFKIKCLGCGRLATLPRKKFERNVKGLLQP